MSLREVNLDANPIVFYTKQLEFYQGKTVCAKVKRSKFFFIDSDNKVETVFKKTVTPVTACTVAGMVTGATAGYFIANVPGAVVGGAVGAGTGFIIGSIISASFLKGEYIEWKRTHRKTNFLREFTKFHENHVELQDFIDPVSLEVFEVPVITKYGQVYSQKTLIDAIQQQPDGNNDPKRNGNLGLNDFHIHYLTIGKMAKAYRKILEQDQDLDGLAPEVKKGLQSISRDLEKEINEIFDRENEAADRRCHDGEITRDEYLDLLNQLNRDLKG